MATVSATFEQLHIRLAESLVACRTHADCRAVHTLRTTTRRLEALLQKVLADHPRARRLRDSIKGALECLGEIRRSAGAIRDLDVHATLIQEIREKLDLHESMDDQGQVGDAYERLDHSLKRRRKRLAVKLGKMLKDAEPEVERALDGLPEALRELHLSSLHDTARKLLRDHALPLKDVSGKRLHRYRKQTKAARYLAELQGASPAAQRLAKRLKRILDDIGRWHDLMLLTQEAKNVLGRRSLLTEAIQAERGRAFDVAIRSARALPLPGKG
jgi:CHAD domain-containing protein